MSYIETIGWKKNSNSNTNNNNNSNNNNNNTKHLHQSTSYHSIQYPNSSNNSSIITSRSINNLSDGLIENAELIEKLFPKCRPKSKTNMAEKRNPVEQQSQQICNKIKSDNEVNDSIYIKNTNDNKYDNVENVHHNRKNVWNFMGISPSPSPPPLSSMDEVCHLINQQCNAEKSENRFRSCSKYKDRNSHDMNTELVDSNSTVIRKRNPENEFKDMKIINHDATAKYRLDSLILNKKLNETKEPSKITLDYDANDDDDILFNRYNMDVNNYDNKRANLKINEDNYDQSSLKSLSLTNEAKQDSSKDDYDEEESDRQHPISHLAMAGGKELFSSSRIARTKKRMHNLQSRIGGKIKSKNCSDIGESGSIASYKSKQLDDSIIMPSCGAQQYKKSKQIFDENCVNRNEFQINAKNEENVEYLNRIQDSAKKIFEYDDKTSSHSESKMALNENLSSSDIKPCATIELNQSENNLNLMLERESNNEKIIDEYSGNDFQKSNKSLEDVDSICEQFAIDLKNKLTIVSNNTDKTNLSPELLAKDEIDLCSESDNSTESSKKSFDLNEPIARLIGSVPIAQYEGSPKRYGPKPGYPKRILSNSTDYETLSPQKEPDIMLKSTTLSSENGSPNSSSTSATFSSTDVHSSSSFSCPSNRIKSVGWINSKSKMNECQNSNHEESGQKLIFSKSQITCDEVVKSILNIPIETIDSEKEDNSIEKVTEINKNFKSNNSINNQLDSLQKSNNKPIENGENFNLTELKSNSESTSQSATLMRKQMSPILKQTVVHDEFKHEKQFPSMHACFPKTSNQTSFESTESSNKSDKYLHNNNSHAPDGYLPDSLKNHVNMQSRTGDTLDIDKLKLNYTCLSPEFVNEKELTNLEDAVDREVYFDKIFESISEGIENIMPVLEDGLSSGLPSSDEMDYDPEYGCDNDLAINNHEYNNNNNNNNNNNGRTVIGCESVFNHQTQSSNSAINGNNDLSHSRSYDYYYKHQTDNYLARTNNKNNNAQQQYYSYIAKNNAGQFNSQDKSRINDGKDSVYDASMSYYHSHHSHHSNQLHNHQMIDSDTRNLSSYENNLGNNNKLNYDLNDIPEQSAILAQDKYCISASHSRTPIVSKHSNNIGSTCRNMNGTKQIASHQQHQSNIISSSGPNDVGPGQTQYHYPYHHYYHHHHSSQTSVQQPSHQNHTTQNYPNLSNSPTLLSPNSPGSIPHNVSSSSSTSSSSSNQAMNQHHYKSTQLNQMQTPTQPPQSLQQVQQSQEMSTNPSSSIAPVATGPNARHHHDEDCDTDQETDRLLGSQRNDERGFYDEKNQNKRSNASREVTWEPAVLIEGVLFRARYLGSTQLVCDGQPTKATRMMQAEEAVSRIKAPEGESQPSTEVDLFISTEKIMVLNTDLKEIMMDHALRTISYIADIGELLVLMARRRSQMDEQNDSAIKRTPKMICHVFESEEAQYIAQSIGQAFQVAYMEFLKANGIKDSSFLKEMDYQEVLNSQEIFGDELEMFSKREKQKEVIVPKQKGEILGIVIVESGWGSMLPTVVIANLAQNSPSARCGQLNIGDQIIAINGISLVGLPLSTCQNYVKNTKNQTAVKFTIVPCPPVVEVKIKRPDTKYQLGFSVQNGVICSLLRGGIAERGGVRVGHRIIEINGQSVVAVPHDRIVNLLATSVGEIHMKTMPTSMFRLLTGQESPSFM